MLEAGWRRSSIVVVLALTSGLGYSQSCLSAALEPVAYLAKGQLRLWGLFLRTPDKKYVLMRLDTEGDHRARVSVSYKEMLLVRTVYNGKILCWRNWHL